MTLKRELNLFDVFCITSGAVISAELFILPGIAYAKAGPAVILSFLIAGFIALPALLSASELVSAMPKTGGIYFFVSRSMGYAVGTIAGFSRWFAISLKGAFALIGIGAYAVLITGLPITFIAACCCLFFIGVNLLGTKIAGIIQSFLVIGLLGILAIYILCGFPMIKMDRYLPFFLSVGFQFFQRLTSYLFLTEPC